MISNMPCFDFALGETADEVRATARAFAASAPLPAHAREALISGKWDAIADLLEGDVALAALTGDLLESYGITLKP